MTERYRKIMCPDMDERYFWRAYNGSTGETLECADVAQLLKRIVRPRQHHLNGATNGATITPPNRKEAP
jgi:hypothetical protein